MKVFYVFHLKIGGQPTLTICIKTVLPRLRRFWAIIWDRGEKLWIKRVFVFREIIVGSCCCSCCCWHWCCWCCYNWRWRGSCWGRRLMICTSSLAWKRGGAIKESCMGFSFMTPQHNLNHSHVDVQTCIP